MIQENDVTDQTNVAISVYGESDIAMIAKSKILLDDEKQVEENVATGNHEFDQHLLVQLENLSKDGNMDSKEYLISTPYSCRRRRQRSMRSS